MDGAIGLECAGSYPDGESALGGLPVDRPDVVLLDINLPGMNGIECMRLLKSGIPAAQFIMLTAYQDDERIFESLAIGASGYLLKRSPPVAILEAVTEVHGGGSPMSSYIARRVVQSFSAKPSTPAGTASLSPREVEVLTLLSRGFLYKEISDELKISIDTVRTHLRRIYEKLQVHTRTEAVVKYLKRK